VITRQGDNCDALQIESAGRRSSHYGIDAMPIMHQRTNKQFRNLYSRIVHHYGWVEIWRWFGVAVARWLRSTKLTYVGPG